MSEKVEVGKQGNAFKLVALTEADENAYDYVTQNRNAAKSTGTVGSIAHLVKGGLGAGILGGHVAFMKAGLYPSVVFTFLTGIYVGYCLYILVRSARIICSRTHTSNLSYSDVGEAAVALCPNVTIAKYSKCFRYTIDTIICIDLFGSCACYQLIIAKTIKQLVENQPVTNVEPQIQGYPNLRLYLVCLIVPVIFICLLTELKYLAPFSILANVIIVFCILVTIHYSVQKNPTFEGMKSFGTFYEMFQFLGLSVFSMSFAGVVLPVSNTMSEPKDFKLALIVGNILIVSFVFILSFFGYNGYRENCQIPITINFPLTLMPKILKGLIAAMIYVTHGLNFFVPFHLCWHYLKKRHDPKKLLKWELFYRASFVILVGLVAIVFPNISGVMGFVKGTNCLSNMAFIWPNLIEILVVWRRPGFGRFNWRLWKCLLLISIGLVFMSAGSVVNFIEMVKKEEL